MAVTATLTIDRRSEIVGKWEQESKKWIVLMQATTAREAVELIAKIVDLVGAGENALPHYKIKTTNAAPVMGAALVTFILIISFLVTAAKKAFFN